MDTLPQFPRVFVDPPNIIIELSNGSKEIWGREEDLSKAKIIAEELQMSLRAYEYAIKITNEAMDEINQVLHENNCPENLINEIITDYFQVRPTKPKKGNILLKKFDDKTPEQLLDLAVWYRTRENYYSECRKQIETYLRNRLENMKNKSR